MTAQPKKQNPILHTKPLILLEKLQKHPEWLDSHEIRRHLAKNFLGFCIVYLQHYFTAPPGDFHTELTQALNSYDEKNLLIIGFRGSAKSTFGSLALPLWASLEYPDLYPFIIPVADTALQSAVNIANIKYELDYNRLIKQDYGNIQGEFVEDWSLESDEEWQAKNMLLSNGVRILARSRGQKVRGLRHRQHRPKLVVVDDPEDLEWVRTKENRDKTMRWMQGEVIPAIDNGIGRLIVIGNLLHTDAMIPRLQKLGIFKVLKFALIENDIVRWPGKYPDQQAIDTQRIKAGPIAWQREYLLKIVPDEGQEITEADIHYYDTEPKSGDVSMNATGVDLAISQKTTADYTGMVTASLAIEDAKPKIYVHKYPLNMRIGFHDTIQQAQALHNMQPGLHQFYVEDVAYQRAAIQEMERNMLPVVPMNPINDKRARLKVAANYIKNGTVVFPRTGCEDLLIQLLGFGIEEHDDLVDALVYLILGLAQQGLARPEVILIA